MNIYRFLGTVEKFDRFDRDSLLELVNEYWEIQAKQMNQTMNDNTFTAKEMKAQYYGDSELCVFEVENETSKYMEVLCMNQTGWNITKQTLFTEE